MAHGSREQMMMCAHGDHNGTTKFLDESPVSTRGMEAAVNPRRVRRCSRLQSRLSWAVVMLQVCMQAGAGDMRSPAWSVHVNSRDVLCRWPLSTGQGWPPHSYRDSCQVTCPVGMRCIALEMATVSGGAGGSDGDRPQDSGATSREIPTLPMNALMRRAMLIRTQQEQAKKDKAQMPPLSPAPQEVPPGVGDSPLAETSPPSPATFAITPADAMAAIRPADSTSSEIGEAIPKPAQGNPNAAMGTEAAAPPSNDPERGEKRKRARAKTTEKTLGKTGTSGRPRGRPPRAPKPLSEQIGWDEWQSTAEEDQEIWPGPSAAKARGPRRGSRKLGEGKLRVSGGRVAADSAASQSSPLREIQKEIPQWVKNIPAASRRRPRAKEEDDDDEDEEEKLATFEDIMEEVELLKEAVSRAMQERRELIEALRANQPRLDPADDEAKHFFQAAQAVLTRTGGVATQMVFGIVWKKMYPETPLKEIIKKRFRFAPSVARLLRMSDAFVVTPINANSSKCRFWLAARYAQDQAGKQGRGEEQAAAAAAAAAAAGGLHPAHPSPPSSRPLSLNSTSSRSQTHDRKGPQPVLTQTQAWREVWLAVT
jgi:hypothetical protein